MKIALILLFVLSITFGFSQPSFKQSEAQLTIDKDILYGNFLEPAKSSSFIILFIAGSGPTDGDGNSTAGLKTDCTKKLAEVLATKGIASLRYA